MSAASTPSTDRGTTNDLRIPSRYVPYILGALLGGGGGYLGGAALQSDQSHLTATIAELKASIATVQASVTDVQQRVARIEGTLNGRASKP
jgi:hypothetical protein